MAAPGLVSGIFNALGGALGWFGGHEEADANTQAAQLQHQSTEEALADARAQRAYAQKQYADYLGRLEPYLKLGTGSASTLSNLLARSPYTKTANSGPVPNYAPQGMMTSSEGAGGFTGTAQQPSPLASAALVTLRSPSGQIKQVPQVQAQHYLSMGATQVS